jgi:ABC-2 type transport system ATP-binding protein
MTALAFEVNGLVKRYGKEGIPANDGLTLTVNQGEVFGLLGPNGAGKTTLVRQMAGLSRPTSGSIWLFGHDLVRDPARAADWVALQPQGFGLPRAETARGLVEITGQLRGLKAAEARRETDALLEEFNLIPNQKKRFYDLSGGQRRLVSIATALIGRRPVLIFDEPTNDLDPEIRRVVWHRIRQATQHGTTVVLVTHNVVEAEQALDRVAIIRSGRILAMGTPGELKARVDQQVRLELLFRPEAEGEAQELLSAWSEVLPLGARRYAVVVAREAAESAIARLLPNLERMDDFRIVTPNLEDVYIQLSGGERLAG